MFSKIIQSSQLDINKVSKKQYLQTDTVSIYLQVVLPMLIKGLIIRYNAYIFCHWAESQV